MDANKLVVLRDINYKVQPHCGICVHADLSMDGWGYCNLHTYQHGKHSEHTSRLSIHRAGSCGSFELDQVATSRLGLHAFAEFLPDAC